MAGDLPCLVMPADWTPHWRRLAAKPDAVATRKASQNALDAAGAAAA
jgi:transketolase